MVYERIIVRKESECMPTLYDSEASKVVGKHKPLFYVVDDNADSEDV